MKLEERNGLRILTCDFGYVIHNKKSDTYSSKIYLGKNASLDDFEEVVDESVDKKLTKKMNELQGEVEVLKTESQILTSIFDEEVNK